MFVVRVLGQRAAQTDPPKSDHLYGGMDEPELKIIDV
jgi:hypothetical protein